LRHGGNALLVLLLPFFLAEIGEKAEVIVFGANGSTVVLKFAFDAMPVQDERRWRISAFMLSNPGNLLTGCRNESVKVDRRGPAVLAVNDFANVCHLTTIARER